MMMMIEHLDCGKKAHCRVSGLVWDYPASLFVLWPQSLVSFLSNIRFSSVAALLSSQKNSSNFPFLQEIPHDVLYLCFIKATAMHKFVSFRGVIGAACVQNRIHFANEYLASSSASRENQTSAKVLSDRAALKRAPLDFFQVLQNVPACLSAVCTAQAQALIGNPTSASVYLSVKRRLRLIFYIDVAGMETLSLEQMDCMNTLSFEHLGVVNERKF